MKNLLIYVDQRLGEPSTWSALSVLLLTMHMNIDPGLWHAITLYGCILAGALGVVLAELGTKPIGQVALDALRTLVMEIKAMPDPGVPKPPAAAVLLLLASGGAALALAGCAASKPPQTTVAQVAVALTAADQTALAYTSLPSCPQPGGTLCSDPAVKAKIKAAALAAYAAVKTAEASSSAGDLATASSAIGTLVLAIPSVAAAK